MTQPVPLSQMLCFALYSANHAMQAAYKPMLDELGLTYPQFLVLTQLWEQPEMPMSRLAAALQLESNTLTPMLKRMEGAGLVTRRRDPQDERQVILALTDKAEGLRPAAVQVTSCLVEEIGTPHPELMALLEDVVALRSRLRAIQS
ncbi:MAG TPA: MarR family transcriptional regulator [Gemmobacter sp.]|nr:MarR family transcriptional regulator [Gemmobacter sp.]